MTHSSKLILLLILASGLWATPVTNRVQVSDLLSEAIDQTLDGRTETWQAQIRGEDAVSRYLRDLIHDLELDQTGPVELLIEFSSTDLTWKIIANDGEARNRSFTRQFNLSMHLVLQTIDGDPIHSFPLELEGRDRISANGLMPVLEEPFPVPPGGDFRAMEAAPNRLIFLSISSLTVLAALYFVRST